jgi:large subunit ribosomal protein L31
MKAEVHPDYHLITVVMTDGTKYQTRSTFGKEGDVLNLDVDPLTHPAWQGGTSKVVEKGQLSKFEKRFGSFLSTGPAAAASSANDKDKK